MIVQFQLVQFQFFQGKNIKYSGYQKIKTQLYSVSVLRSLFPYLQERPALSTPYSVLTFIKKE